MAVPVLVAETGSCRVSVVGVRPCMALYAALRVPRMGGEEGVGVGGEGLLLILGAAVGESLSVVRRDVTTSV